MEQSPSWEANRFAASQKITRILRNPKVHYPVTSTHHLSLCWASSIQSNPPHPTSWRSILILSSHLCLGLLMPTFIYCRYKLAVTKLITIQISHCTLPYNVVISHCTDLHLLQIQTYCHKVKHTTDTTLHKIGLIFLLYIINHSP
jgi:hypothetical protein